jgi:hypothetical protein
LAVLEVLLLADCGVQHGFILRVNMRGFWNVQQTVP